jgi:hypothetical protein
MAGTAAQRRANRKGQPGATPGEGQKLTGGAAIGRSTVMRAQRSDTAGRINAAYKTVAAAFVRTRLTAACVSIHVWRRSCVTTGVGNFQKLA